MDAEQSNSAPGSLVRRLGRWARGDKYMVGAYPAEWKQRAASEDAVVPADQPTIAVDQRAIPVLAAVASGA